MYGLMQGCSLERCCEVGCLGGAAAVRCYGAELSAAEWQWFHAHIHGAGGLHPLVAGPPGRS
jgi:hypothetical protein